MTTDKYVAAVDMGTNSFHMIIAKVEANQTFRIVDRMKHWVRLGDGVDHRGRLDEAAIDRMIESLRFFKQLAESYDAFMHCIATSAMRDAPNSKAITRRILDELGLVIEIVNGDEEARLVFQGVRSEGYLNLKEGSSHIIDIGGGSTEVIVGDQNGVLTAESLDMGARRYTRLFFDNQRYTKHQLNKCRKAAASKIQSVANAYKSFPIQGVYGTSGTIRVLAEITAMFCQLDDSSQLTLSDLKSTRAKLIDAVKNDALQDSVEAERQATLVAGAIILEEIMAALNIHSLRVCPSALREGIVFDRIETTGRLPSFPIRASTTAMALRFNLDKDQILRVSKTALLIFDAYAQKLHLNREARRLLAAACHIHEIGLSISHKKIHMHGSYIVANANITGVTQRQQHMLAAIVRFHRKSSPSVKNPYLKNMREQDVQSTRVLAAILRLAAALNRTKNGDHAAPQFEEHKKAWHWSFEDKDWYHEHDVCIWNAEQEKRPLGKLLGKPIRFKTV